MATPASGKFDLSSVCLIYEKILVFFPSDFVLLCFGFHFDFAVNQLASLSTSRGGDYSYPV
jgi:hypothetical protein